jgi:DNA-binding CsgD family transcriptional regulator
MAKRPTGTPSGGNTLRPIERRVLALWNQGLPVPDIARRFRRGEAHIQRIIDWTEIPRQAKPKPRAQLRPVERRVLGLRAQGMSYEEIGTCFRRDAAFAHRIEDFAKMRFDLGLIS